MEDMVNHPPHYTQGNVECIEAIEASMPPWEFRGYLKGTVIKYLWRYENKQSPSLDLGKCGFFLDRLEKHVKENPISENQPQAEAVKKGDRMTTKKTNNLLAKDMVVLGILGGVIIGAYQIGKKRGFDEGTVLGTLSAYRSMLEAL